MHLKYAILIATDHEGQENLEYWAQTIPEGKRVQSDYPGILRVRVLYVAMCKLNMLAIEVATVLCSTLLQLLSNCKHLIQIENAIQNPNFLNSKS